MDRPKSGQRLASALAALLLRIGFFAAVRLDLPPGHRFPDHDSAIVLMLGGYVLIPLGVFVHERRRLGQPRVTPHAIFVGVLAARGPAAALLSRFEVAACASPAAHDAGEQGLSFDRRRGG